MKVTALASVLALGLTISAAAQDRANTLGNGVEPMATTDPQIMIYRVTGVRNTFHTGEEGVSTVFHCYSNSSSTEIIRFRLLHFDGILAIDRTYNLSPKRTFTAATHATDVFYEDALLNEGTGIGQGTAAIIATSKEIFCTAMIMDAASPLPNGVALHMVRYNPAPGTVE